MKTKRITQIFLCLALLIVMGGEMLLSAFSITASAETNIQSLDDTAIEDDLSNVDLANYPKNEFGESDIISFMEYCYTNHSYYEKYFGIYIYVYNPTTKAISATRGTNKVNALVGVDENGNSVYEKVNLQYLDKTADNLFYKFKIENSGKYLSTVQEYATAHEGVRRYEIIELELRHGTEIENVDVSKCYEWSGYAAYCDENNSAVSTLECKDYGTRSIHLSLKQTNYRFATQSDGYTQDELNSVFFTLPEEYYQEFGNLHNITAEWYEYKTSPMFVTSDSGAYSGLWDMRGIEINEFGFKKYADDSFVGPPSPNGYDQFSGCYWRVFWEEYVASANSSDMSVVIAFRKTFNGKCRDDVDDDGYWDGTIFNPSDQSNGYTFADNWSYLPKMDWLFYVEDVTGSGAYRVSADEVKEYMRKYTNDFPNQERILGKYASSLFTDSIDADRIQFLEDQSKKSGYVKMDFTAGEDFNENIGNSFIDADKGQSAWNKFWFGTNYETLNYSPIEVIKEGDLYLSVGEFAEKYYINTDDVPDIVKSAKEAYSKEERPVLLRFAVTDYYASTARFDYAEEDAFEMSSYDGYVAQETCFLDFDILSMGFKSEEGFTDIVIGVVAEPIDIINGLTPPEGLVEEQEWWQKLMMILMIILVVVILSFFFSPIKAVLKVIWEGIKFIFSMLWAIITLPIQLIQQAFSKDKPHRKRKRR